MKIAIIGWGSLIWGNSPQFDATIGPWATDGPVLPLEFCRISQTRKGALVLVIDPELGTQVPALYTLSTRTDPDDALADLQAREKTTMNNIGFVDLLAGEQRGRFGEVIATITTWAQANDIQVALWTDLASNFKSKKSVDFSHEAALKHLKGLSKSGRREAVKYIVKAPAQVDTQFRAWLATDEWWNQQVELFADSF